MRATTKSSLRPCAKSGIELKPGHGDILDVGANIGLFALFCHKILSASLPSLEAAVAAAHCEPADKTVMYPMAEQGAHLTAEHGQSTSEHSQNVGGRRLQGNKLSVDARSDGGRRTSSDLGQHVLGEEEGTWCEARVREAGSVGPGVESPKQGVAEAGRIFAFEPVPRIYRVLCRNLHGIAYMRPKPYGLAAHAAGERML